MGSAPGKSLGGHVLVTIITFARLGGLFE